MARAFFHDPAVMASLAAELVAWGRGARVQKVRVVSPVLVEVELHKDGTTRLLQLDAQRGCAVVTTRGQRRAEDQQPPAFQGLLRKHLVNTRLEAVTVLGTAAVEVLFVTLAAPLKVVVDWAGAHANILLLHAGRGVVMGASDPTALKPRGLRMGQPFVVAPVPAVEMPRMPEVDAAALVNHPLGDMPTHAALELLEQVTPKAAASVVVDVPLRRAVRAQRDKQRRLVAGLQRDISNAGGAAALRTAAQRANTQLADVPRGVEQWTVVDPYDADAPAVTVRVDPAAGPRENVEKLFHRARRMDKTVTLAAPRLVEAQQKLLELDALLLALDAGDAAAAPRAALLVGPTGVQRVVEHAKGPARRQPFRAYTTSTGHRVLAGKGAADNDQLTHKVARGNDVFLHARDATGAHVILVLEGSAAAPDAAMREAALLAAHHSEARGHGVVDVRHTLVKHVRKVPGTKGLVTLAKERVLRVSLEDPRLAVLLGTEMPASTRL